MVIAPPTSPCPRCGVAVAIDDRFCEACGHNLAPVAQGHGVDGPLREIDAGAAAGLTHRGLVKAENQDALFLQYADRRLVAVVCDGVSTSVSAAEAARLACTAAGAALTRPPGAGATDAAIAAAVADAQRAVLSIRWQQRAMLAAPSCTIVVAVSDGTTITVGSLGDSRAYWVDAERAAALTADDSWARYQIDAGLMTRDEAEADGRAHQITRWLGADAPDLDPSVTVFVPDRPGWLIVCSDGLWNYASTVDELGGWVRDHAVDAPPIELARALVDRALAGGGHDNITVAVAAITPAPKGPPS